MVNLISRRGTNSESLKATGSVMKALFGFPSVWRELEAKARSTPNAVLGMLDILNSHSVRPTTAREHLEPLVANAVGMARRHQPSEATWRFYVNLLGKFSDRLPSHKTLRELRNASELLAADDPASAILALRDLEIQGRDVPPVLAAGIGTASPYVRFVTALRHYSRASASETY